MQRNIIRLTIADHLYGKHIDLDETQERIVRRIERSCFNKTIRAACAQNIHPTFETENFVAIYSSYCYKIIANNCIILDIIKL